MKYDLDEAQVRLIRWSLEVAKQALDASESIAPKDKMDIYAGLDNLQQETFKL